MAHKKMRELACHAVNELLTQGVFSLDFNANEKESGCIKAEICGKDSIIKWNTNMDWYEVHISIWWGVAPDCPNSKSLLSKPHNYKHVEAYCGVWLERMHGKWVQHRKSEIKQQRETYGWRRGLKPEILNIPDAKNMGYEKYGIWLNH